MCYGYFPSGQGLSPQGLLVWSRDESCRRLWTSVGKGILTTYRCLDMLL